MTGELYSRGDIQRERAGAQAALNPMFGEWEHAFRFAPVPYGDGGAKRAAFKKEIQSQLGPIRWLYSNEVRLEIELFLDVQNVLETSKTADLDNYAKAILDGLKGPGGIMFDDTQVQALGISWLDHVGNPHFAVKAKSSPDDFVMKPAELYEMSDGLWYPQSRLFWSTGDNPSSELHHFAGLSITEMMSSIKRRARAEIRNSGHNRTEAYQKSAHISFAARGFHRSRIADAGFTLHAKCGWQEQRLAWKNANPGKIDELEKLISDARENYEGMIEILSGRGSPPG